MPLVKKAYFLPNFTADSVECKEKVEGKQGLLTYLIWPPEGASNGILIGRARRLRNLHARLIFPFEGGKVNA